MKREKANQTKANTTGSATDNAHVQDNDDTRVVGSFELDLDTDEPPFDYYHNSADDMADISGITGGYTSEYYS
jgi:hypothetical protein